MCVQLPAVQVSVFLDLNSLTFALDGLYVSERVIEKDARQKKKIKHQKEETKQIARVVVVGCLEVAGKVKCSEICEIVRGKTHRSSGALWGTPLARAAVGSTATTTSKTWTIVPFLHRQSSSSLLRSRLQRAA